MLTAFKTPVGILCHCILSPLLPPLSLTVACMSACLQASQSGSVTLCCFSSWLLLSLFHHPFLSHSFFYPTFPLPIFILLPLSLSPPLLLSDLFSLMSSRVELPTVSLFCHHPPPSHLALSWPEHLLPSSHSSLTHWQKRRSRIRCELNLPAVKT